MEDLKNFGVLPRREARVQQQPRPSVCAPIYEIQQFTDTDIQVSQSPTYRYRHPGVGVAWGAITTKQGGDTDKTTTDTDTQVSYLTVLLTVLLTPPLRANGDGYGYGYGYVLGLDRTPLEPAIKCLCLSRGTPHDIPAQVSMRL